MKHPKRLYEVTAVIPGKRGKPPTTRKIKVSGIDSVHASQTIYRAYKHTKIKVISAVLVKDE